MKRKFQVGDYVLVKSGKYRGCKGEVRGFQSGDRSCSKKYYVKSRSIYNVFLENSDGRYEDRDFYSYELEIIYQFQKSGNDSPRSNKIKHIDLVFENCESARLGPDMFYALSISGIQRNYNVNCAQYKNGEYWESITCERFHIIINKKGLKEAKFNSPQFDKKETLKSRLDKWKDITHVHMYFENKDDQYISVPWKSEEDDRYDTTNKCQSHEYEEDGNLMIEIEESDLYGKA